MAQFAITDNLNWTVSHRPLSFVGNDGVSVAIKEKVAVVRDDNGVFLGTVSPDYETVQNSVLLGMVQPMIEEGLLEMKNVGYLNGGAKVFVQAEVTEGFKVLGEDYRGAISLLNGFTGNCAVALGVSNIRIICNNTFSMAYQNIGEKFRHSVGVNERVLESTAVIDYVNGAMKKYSEYAETLAQARCTTSQFRESLERIYERPVKDMRESFVSQLEELFHRGAGNEGRTFYDAWNSVTDYNSNQSRKTDSGRYLYTNFGQGSRVARRALGVLSEMAAV
jgi:phage/plasmid-like protein (TIGR03299 family)